jgi:hypothetical protein
MKGEKKEESKSERADKKFSNKLKAEIRDYRHIIFYFLKEVAPDITGFIKKDYSSDFIVIEVKAEAVKLDHIYQTRKSLWKR